MLTKTKRASSKKSSYIYHVDAKYKGYDVNTDKAIISMAKASGGKLEGSGYGMGGYRDISFLFKSRADATRFINKLKAKKIRRSGISNWSKYL